MGYYKIFSITVYRFSLGLIHHVLIVISISFSESHLSQSSEATLFQQKQPQILVHKDVSFELKKQFWAILSFFIFKKELAFETWQKL